MTKTLREDLALALAAIQYGWEIIFHISDREGNRFDISGGPKCPMFSLQFKKGDRRLWRASLGWRYARLVDGNYIDHVWEEDLESALKKY